MSCHAFDLTRVETKDTSETRKQAMEQPREKVQTSSTKPQTETESLQPENEVSDRIARDCSVWRLKYWGSLELGASNLEVPKASEPKIAEGLNAAQHLRSSGLETRKACANGFAKCRKPSKSVMARTLRWDELNAWSHSNSCGRATTKPSTAGE
jgi:hypothetical protein